MKAETGNNGKTTRASSILQVKSLLPCWRFSAVRFFRFINTLNCLSSRPVHVKHRQSLKVGRAWKKSCLKNKAKQICVPLSLFSSSWTRRLTSLHTILYIVGADGFFHPAKFISFLFRVCESAKTVIQSTHGMLWKNRLSFATTSPSFSHEFHSIFTAVIFAISLLMPFPSPVSSVSSRPKALIWAFFTHTLLSLIWWLICTLDTKPSLATVTLQLCAIIVDMNTVDTSELFGLSYFCSCYRCS